MKYSVRTPGRCYFLIFVLSVFAFWMYRTSAEFYYINETVYYITNGLGLVANGIIPVFSAMMLILSTKEGTRARTLLAAVKLSAPRLAFLLPYYYLYYMSMGFDSAESIGFLLIHTLFLFILFTLEIFMYSLVTGALLKRRGGNLSEITVGGVFNLTPNLTFVCFCISLMKFTVAFINELYHAIEYLVEYAGDYRIGDITYMLGKFVFIFIIMLISHILAYCTREVFLLKKCEA